MAGKEPKVTFGGGNVVKACEAVLVHPFPSVMV